ncbi:MAG: glycosyltransferase family 1 protein [Candidatus Nanoarchaeia archaeon]|nr:glycosyltransferase family 1 protein [Candidatus Nanoarchaeia archaeon]
MIKLIKPEDELFIIHNLKEPYFKSDKKNIHEIILKPNSKIICDFLISPNIINSLNLDVCLFPKDVIPYRINCKKIVTILDIGHFRPEFNAYGGLDNVYMRFMIKSSCKRADKIISISENTKKELIDILNISKDKIKTIHLATSFKRFLKKKNKLSNYIFYSGSISPRKNLLILIKAFERLENKNVLLYITGNNMWNNKKEMRLIKNNPKIKVLGLVSKEELINLYQHALVGVYPSLYEGFGLPILEAQACGCPVITSNVSSMPEVAGKGALLVNPYSINEITNAMKKILKDKKLRGRLIKEGFKNVKMFSWKKCARETMKVCGGIYKNV